MQHKTTSPNLSSRQKKSLRKNQLANSFLLWRFAVLLPKHLSLTPLDPSLERKRLSIISEFEQLISMISKKGADPCALCGGDCCRTGVGCFTEFDYLIRLGTDYPLSHLDTQRCLSRPFQCLKAVLSRRYRFLLERSRILRDLLPPPTNECCSHLSESGCALPRSHRPIVCISYLCNKLFIYMDNSMCDTHDELVSRIVDIYREVCSNLRSYS